MLDQDEEEELVDCMIVVDVFLVVSVCVSCLLSVAR